MKPICNHVRAALHSLALLSYHSDRRNIARTYFTRRPNDPRRWVGGIGRALERELKK